MKDAATAISDDKFVAVLGLQFVNTSSGRTSSKTAVFVHRPGGEKRLSTSKSQDHSSSRRWVGMDKSFWNSFKEMVGIKGNTYSCRDLKESLYMQHKH